MKTVTLPLWAVVLGGLVCTWAVLVLIVRGLGSLLRRREERFLGAIKARYGVELPAFKLVRKRSVVARLMTDAQVLRAVEERSRERAVPPESLLRQAESYAREIAPAFHAYAYYLWGSFLASFAARLLYRVRVRRAEDHSARRTRPSSLVFIINHRSNMDYILLAYLTLRQAPLSFAVGEWARVWPLKGIITAMGAYFVRRRSEDPLYRKVLSRYVRISVEGGIIQAVFPEGRLSRDGMMAEPKMGLLDYIVRGFDQAEERDIVFVPVGVNYDRVLEDRTLLLAGSRRGKKRAVGAALTTARFIIRHARLMLRGGWKRFGYAAMGFGAPLSLAEYLRSRGLDFKSLGEDERRIQVQALTRRLMDEVGRQVPVLPVPLTATVFTRNPDARLTESEVERLGLEYLEELERSGAGIQVPRGGREAAVQVGLIHLVLRRFVLVENDLYRANPREAGILRYYANSIAHLFRPEEKGATTLKHD